MKSSEGELPEGYSEHKDEYKRTFYYNILTKESTWSRPRYPAYVLIDDPQVEVHPNTIEQQRQR